VDVFGHDHVADYIEPITATGLFERSLKDILRMVRVEEGLPPITSECDEVETVGSLESDKSPRHEERLRFLLPSSL
jgi:hypothetical protein